MQPVKLSNMQACHYMSGVIKKYLFSSCFLLSICGGLVPHYERNPLSIITCNGLQSLHCCLECSVCLKTVLFVLILSVIITVSNSMDIYILP